MPEYLLGIATLIGIYLWFDKLGVWAALRRLLLNGVWETPKQLTPPPTETPAQNTASAPGSDPATPAPRPPRNRPHHPSSQGESRPRC